MYLMDGSEVDVFLEKGKGLIKMLLLDVNRVSLSRHPTFGNH